MERETPMNYENLVREVLAAAAKVGIGPKDDCLVGQPGRLWPLGVLIEMNLQRIDGGFAPLPIRTPEGEEFYRPWSYAELGATNEMELATLFGTIAATLERLRDDDCEEDTEEAEFEDELEQEADFGEFEDEDGDDDDCEIMLPALELNPNYKGDPEEESREITVDDMTDSELSAAAKADAEIDRFNMVLEEQLQWMRNYPDPDYRIEFYKILRDFIGKAADALDELY